MPSTYMNLTNKLLRRLNEVEISQSDFPSVRGVQALAKDAIQDTVKEIYATRIDWPFNAVEHEATLEVGVEEYPWPVSFMAPDWNSFQIQKDDVLNINHKRLKPIDRDQWYERIKDVDDDSETDGRNIPQYVFQSHGQGFGVSPSPDEEYTIKFRYYANPSDLTDYDDQVTIPSKFDYVILAGAAYYMNLFKENPQATAIMQGKYKEGIRDMVNLFLPNPIAMYDGRVNFGGGGLNSEGFWWP